MAWLKIKPRNDDPTRAVPRASVGYGRIELNKAAKSMLGGRRKFEYAELLLDADSDRVGIRFISKPSPSAIPVKQKRSKGKPVGGLTISSKAHVGELFGNEGLQRKTTHYNVARDDSEANLIVLTK